MIAGFFDPYGRPAVRGLVTISLMGIQHTVNFLVDTGADVTCLHHPDVSVAGVNPQLLEEVSQAARFGGVGGAADYFVTPARVDFLEEPDRKTVSYNIDLCIAASSQEGLNKPSLLGRDILNQHLMVYDPRNGRLELHRD